MASRPNILFIITHDTGRHIGGYGQGVETPQIDRIAADGVRWLNCFCSAPQCSPSRASVVSGQMPHVHGEIGLTHRGFRMRRESPKAPQLFADAGYSTWLFGFQHESPDPGPELGYQQVVPGQPRRYDCDDVTRQVLDWLPTAGKQPFYASVGFSQTHRVFSSSGESPLDNVVVPAYLPDVPAVRRDFADFNVDLAKVDACVGRILDGLDAAGLADDTVVVFTTDHGVAFPGAKGTLFDPGIGIGCVMRGLSGLTGGRDLHALVSNIDYLPTFLEAAEIAIPAEVQGRSLLPLARGEVESIHDEVFAELTVHAGYDPMRAVRTRTHKYIRSYEYRPYWFPPNVDDGLSKQHLKDSWQFKEIRPRELLFDLVDDPNETRNIAREPAAAAVLADLRGRVDQMMAETDDLMLTGLPGFPADMIVTPPTNFQPPHEPE